MAKLSKKSTATASAYQTGYDLGLDALEALSKKTIPPDQLHSVYAGLLTAVLTALYHAAPDKDRANAVLNFAQETADLAARPEV